jgi:alpha-methylacyl-CoA racemase
MARRRMSALRQGPLTGVRIVEFAGIGPGPFCGMLLSDLGADVVRVDRVGARDPKPTDIVDRGRRSIAVDLKQPEGVALSLDLIARADALIESFRPGVMERLGLGPDEALVRNPRLVYGRMTGWGQLGPLAQSAGHDINYISLSGALHAIGIADKPVVPLNLVGDLGGGALYLALGLLSGIVHARATGEGQIVDCAIVDGAASLMAMFYGLHAAGHWRDERQANAYDGGAHYYDTYRCSDGAWISLGPLEPHFYDALLEHLGIDEKEEIAAARGRANWPKFKEQLARIFARRSRAEWCSLLEGSDACFAPVLSLADAPAHPHNASRGTFAEVGGVVQPAPAPRFSRTPGAIQRPPSPVGGDAEAILADWGLGDAR